MKEPRSSCVLVVDDDPLIRLVVSRTLSEAKLRVVEARHGLEGLEAFAAEPVDLILLDVMMPLLDGFSTCERMRKLENGRHVPIVMMTGLDDEASIQRAYEVGATDFITKPINPPILAHRIRYILRASAAMNELAWREGFQRVLIETTPVPILVEDSDGRCNCCNAAMESLLGKSRAEILNSCSEILALQDQETQELEADEAGNPLRIFETVLIGNGNKQRSVIVHQARFNPPPPGSPGVINAFVDMTEHKRNEKRLRLADTVFRTAVDAILVTDADGLIKSVNPAFSAITGYDKAEVIGQSVRMLNSHHHDEGFYTEMALDIQQTGKWSGEIWQHRKTGEVFPTWITMAGVRNNEGSILEYVMMFNDITQRKQAEQEIFFRANYDPLTGLPNRSLLQERLEQALRQGRRYQRRMALMFLDLDRFKQVNDTLGHSVGDSLLCQTADRLKACLRETDTVARYSGDEFAIVLLDIVRETDVHALADKIITRLADKFHIHDNLVRIGASIGIALFPDHGEDTATLLRHADLAMYQAKASGRNTFRLYEAYMSERAVHQLSLETDLRIALERRQFTLHYQPIIELRSGQLVGAEALLRWCHPQRGLVPPSDFIPLAEETGIIRDLGAWVLEEVCLTIRGWRQRGLRIPISVNLSSVQILRGLPTEAVERLLRRHRLPPEALAFEITESLLLMDTLQTRQWLESVRALGIRVDIDDFGTGYSSLSYLKRFPVNRIKIDRSFIRDMTYSTSDRALVAAILAMARSLDLEVVAEGVENEEQFLQLCALGCTYGQGFYVAQPLAATDFSAMAQAIPQHPGRWFPFHQPTPDSLSPEPTGHPTHL